MASALVDGLTAPLRDLQATLGAGTPDTASALAGVRSALDDVAVATSRSGQATRWEGDAGTAAASFAEATAATVQAMAARADRLAAASASAVDAVSRARARLQQIVSEFEARAAELESRLDEPGVAEELVGEARRARDDAEAVVDDLRTDLDGHTAAVDASAPPSAQPSGMSSPASMPTIPMGAVPGLGGRGAGSGSGAAVGSASGPRSGGPSAGGHLATGTEGHRAGGTQPLPDPGMFGSGVEVGLPDGSTATAPNETAASAVRHALTQLGVPYDWGGTTPGVGLDCSGLTQWAYHEAGLDLPRLAQEQDVGSAVTQATVRPGDLAVWDGHVAMVVGNGLMVEAGDPVQLSAIRITNAGQGFQGFWRPTA
ncbi:C40 family peptidase [Mycobacterium yunnanensis]|uniref:C40 family peptidase n=1 Tax=Mycobacterium yunnanensis TaxID=368477 RepID=A0A9X2Z339_9MYCO|nr:C40 family peptidase [Mycobacterium yunnanensis]MCV7421891.1 C40 family peptidase [Mycobacterium yunnanensis]